MMQRITAVIFSVKWETDVIQMGSVVVVADTHLGITKDSFSMPGYFADFLKYLKDEMEQKSVKIFDGTVKEKVLQEPEKVIFLGDIIELWDSEDEAVNFCLSSLVPILSEMRAEKIYILGNHDNTLERASLLRKDEYYVLGKSTLRLVENTYPSDGFLKIGKENYLFVHGHQFSPGLLFRLASAIDELFGTLLSKEIRVYDIIPSMRKLRNCIGSFFSYIFILFFLLHIHSLFPPFFCLLGDRSPNEHVCDTYFPHSWNADASHRPCQTSL